MGAAACKSSKSVSVNQPKDVNKNITIGVFGLDDAGKTSTVKAIDGDPTDDTTPTIGSFTTMVTNPLQKKNTNQQRIKIIDIHGWIFVIDASDRRRLAENQEILEDLLAYEQLKDKPVLILGNKQDEKNAVNKEQDLKRQLKIERLKSKHKIELCTSTPRKSKSKVDDSIRNGFSWLIRTIDENYTTLNARVNKATKGSSFNRKTHPSDSDDNENINPYSRDKPTGAYRPKITSEKLPSINTKKTTSRFNSDDDDDIVTAKSDLNKKKKLIGATGNNDNERLKKRVNGDEPKAFRATFESFPEEAPWSVSTSSKLKPAKSETTLPKLYSKPSSTYDTKRRDVSPLIHDAKPYSNGSTFKRDNHSDDDDDYYSRQKSKPTTSRFAMNTTKPGYSTYGDEDISRRIITGVKKSYNDDDDDDNYLKKSSSTTLRKNYGLDEKSSYTRPSKPKYDDDDDEEDNHRWSSSSKPGYSSKYDKDDYSSSRVNNRSRYDEEDRSYSSSKPISHSKFDDDDYPTANRSTYNGKSSSRFNDDDNYRPSSSSKPVTRSKYSDDDDDDINSSSTRKNNYPSRSNQDDFFTTRPGSSSNTRFKSTSGYDS